MSYWVSIVDAEGTLRYSDIPHGCAGGTYAPGDTALQLNVTYNYSALFREALGGHGLRELHGKLVADTLPLLQCALTKLPEGSPASDYWEATPGNVRVALNNLCTLAKLAPAGAYWRVS